MRYCGYQIVKVWRDRGADYEPARPVAISSTRPSGYTILGGRLGWMTIARSLSSKVQRSRSLSL